MGKEKIKIRYIIFVLITMGVIFFGKITRLDNLNAEKSPGSYSCPHLIKRE